MRRGVGLALLVIAFGLAVSARGQNFQPQSIVGGTPRQINFQVVDTSKAIAPMNIAQSFRTPKPPSSFTLSSAFPRLTLGGWPPKLPNLSLFKPKGPPTPPNPQKAFGLNPQQAFGGQQ